jgi:iron complex outermembrane receptor protein
MSAVCSRTRAFGVACVLAASSLAWAEGQHDVQKAKQLFEQGNAQFREGKFDEAIESFTEANELVPHPHLLYNIAQAYRRKGDCDKALRYYRDFLQAEPTTPNRTKVEGHITAMQQCAGASATKPTPSPGPSRVKPPVGAPTEGQPKRLEPKPTAAVSNGPRTHEPPATTPGGSVAPERTDEDQPSPGRGKRIAGLITAGMGLAAVGTGVYFELQSRDARSKIDELFEDGGEWSDEFARLEKRADRDRTIGIVMFASGGVALVTGVVVYYLGWKDGRRVDVGLGPGEAGASVRVSF